MRRRVLGAVFVGAGALHFVRPKMYEAIMPPYLPAHRELVLVSGAAEIVGGAAAMSPRWNGFARWWLTALLLAVFPANVHMALHPGDRAWKRVPPWALWARLPFQAGFIAWVWRVTGGRR